jgi:hypothetical protein
MSDDKLFVIGAGASAELEMPVGQGLKAQIKGLLTFEFDGAFGPSKGSKSIASELERLFREEKLSNLQFKQLYYAAEIATKGLGLAESIDSYLDLHRENKEVSLMGKMAIVEAILAAEEKAYKRLFNSEHTVIDLNFIENTWYAKLLRHLTRGKPKEDINNIFKNISFIIFNYDRAVELIFPMLLSYLYDVDLETAVSSFEKATIIHPYGKVGNLLHPSQGWARGFGKKSKHLSEHALEINTFTEGESNITLAQSIDDAVARASTIVFLGYGFIEMNNSILMRAPIKKVERVFGTAKGLSSSDLTSISERICEGFHKPRSVIVNSTSAEVIIRDRLNKDSLYLTDKTCSAFFDEYRLTL